MERRREIRIRVRQGDECVTLAPGKPKLSSAHSRWKGALLESHEHGPHHADQHQHLSHFLCLNFGNPAPLVWRSKGKSGNKMLEPGEVVLLSHGTEDSVSFPKPVKRVLLNLEPSLLQEAFAENNSGREIELIDHWGVRDGQIEHIVRALEADVQAGLPAGRLFGETLVSALALHLHRRYGVVPHRDVRLRNGLPGGRLSRVLEYIDANLEHDVALAQLAATSGMSPHYFAELFKQSVGLSPHQYVIRKRIDRARRLLRSRNTTILEAGVRSGFSDHSHFTKVFRRIVGVTPIRYRAEI